MIVNLCLLLQFTQGLGASAEVDFCFAPFPQLEKLSWWQLRGLSKDLKTYTICACQWQEMEDEAIIRQIQKPGKERAEEEISWWNKGLEGPLYIPKKIENSVHAQEKTHAQERLEGTLGLYLWQICGCCTRRR